MIDFNISHNLTDDVTISNDLLLVLQQIELLFDTNKNTVLGDNNFGTNYDRYLYKLNMSSTDLENHIFNDIKNNIDLRGFDIQISVSIVEGTVRDIAIIDITLIGDFENYNTTYVIK